MASESESDASKLPVKKGTGAAAGLYTSLTTKLTNLRAAYRWWRPHLNSYAFLTSQGTGYVGAFGWASAHIVRSGLQKYGMNKWTSTIYPVIIVFGSLAVYETYNVTSIYFVNPAPLATQKPRKIETSPSSTHTNTDTNTEVDTATAQQMYTYTPLSPKVYTRLLLLYPSLSRKAELQGKLVDFPYDTPVYFQALSYAWGSNNRDQQILIEGKRLAITTSCASALRQLRLRATGILIWVDSICIDQANLEEKNEQLQHMQRIYSNAADTIIWLDDESGYDEMVLRYCRLFAVGKHFGEKVQKWVEKKVRRKLSERKHDFMFSELLRNSWMSRIWTVQELALGKWDHTWVLCGSHQVLFDYISFPLTKLASFNTLADTYTLDGMIDNVCVSMRSLARIGLMKEPVFGEPTSMSKLLHWAQTQYATDPRDKIYGLFAFFDANEIVVTNPTYAKSPPVVYRDAMVAICNHEQNLDLLELCSGYRLPDMAAVPSWVPDFRTPATPRRILSCNYKAAGDSIPRFAISSTEDYLIVHAMVVDEVRTVSQKTLWSPENPTRATRDGFHVNLEEGARQSLEALLEWLHAAFGRDSSIYQDDTAAFREMLLLGSTIPYTPRENFLDWMTLLASLRPLDSQREGSISPSNLLELLTTHTRSVPELYEKYFDPSSPLHELTQDVYWCLMAIFKTNQAFNEIYHYVWTLNRECKFFTTEAGCIGTGAMAIQSGDCVALIAGLERPMILRKVRPSVFRVVGIAYVQGLMDGSCWNSLDSPDVNGVIPIMLV